jgi:hypothetical protein
MDWRMTMADRVSPRQARTDIDSEHGALLVCAYDDEKKCRQNKLNGSVSFHDLQARADSLPKDRELIFYCA